MKAKHFIKIAISILLFFIGIKLLLPFKDYPIEHFENLLVSFLPISWQASAIISRILVGFLFCIAFLLIFDIHKLRWAKYGAIVIVFLPFVINAVFLENFIDNTVVINKDLNFDLKSLKEGNNLILFASYNCSHCKESIKKLDVAINKNIDFPNLVVVSYNRKIDKFLKENKFQISVDSISPKQFIEITGGTFPVFKMVKDGKIVAEWSNHDFNYAVLDNLKN